MKEGDALSLPKGWEVKKLGEVCDFVRGPFGGSLKKSCFKSDGYAVYEQQHAIYNQFSDIRYFIDDDKFAEMQRFELLPNDLIMSCSGTMGKVAIVPNTIKKGIINQALLKLTTNQQLDVNFLKLWMESDSFYKTISDNSVGAAIKNVASVKVLKQIYIPIPPLPEQKRIVAILDRAFEAIDKAKANTEQNLKNAKELFESYLQGVFENKGDDWVEKKLGDIGVIQTGTTPSTREKLNYGCYIPFAKPPHFKKNGTIETVNSMLSEKGLKKGRLINANSVLMVCIGATIGKTGFTTTPISANQQINSFTPNPNFYAKFFYFTFISSFFQDQVLTIGKSAQATLPIINKTKWKNLYVRYPKSIDKQKCIVIELEKLSSETKKLEAKYLQQLENLSVLKKSILQQAFSGEM